MKSMLYFVVGILILSGLTVVGMSDAGEKQETLQLSFLAPIVVEHDGYVEIQVDGTTEYLAEPDRPVLPVLVKTYQIPFRSTDIQVMCSVHDIGSMKLTKQVVPARIVPLSQVSELTGYVTDPVVYDSEAFYPESWFSYDLGAGRNEENVQVTFVKVVCYPVRYSPMNNEIQYAGGFDIQLSYTEPQTPQAASAADDYDMVIIAPAKFQAALEPLVTHKNTKGVSTLFKSVEDILAE
ncbi:MAG: hypothetical protein JW840_00925, partial [Candidatus Thermoplasmatota archaeon]|nr:hypothetical protein [Candidatus Thermoplasmatota archaeon]